MKKSLFAVALAIAFVPAAASQAGDACDVCDVKCASPAGVTWSLAAEIALLRPYDTDSQAAVAYDAKAAYRLALAATNQCGTGVRVRWFDYDDTSSLPDQGVDRYQVETLDVEFVTAIDLGCNLHGVFSAGGRYAEYFEYDGDDLDTVNGSFGPVLGVELHYDLCHNLSLFGLGRHALMYGNYNGFEQNYQFHTFSISEIQLGAQYKTNLCGSCAFVRCAMEAQRWEGVNDYDTQDFGLFGGTFAAGIVY
jgi:hypothetical protein